MEKDSKKKLAVAIIAAFMVVLFALETAGFIFLNPNPVAIAVVLLLDVVLTAAMVWYAMERLDEIREGADNDVDNY